MDGLKPKREARVDGPYPHQKKAPVLTDPSKSVLVLTDPSKSEPTDESRQALRG